MAVGVGAFHRRDLVAPLRIALRPLVRGATERFESLGVGFLEVRAGITREYRL